MEIKRSFCIRFRPHSHILQKSWMFGDKLFFDCNSIDEAQKMMFIFHPRIDCKCGVLKISENFRKIFIGKVCALELIKFATEILSDFHIVSAQFRKEKGKTDA